MTVLLVSDALNRLTNMVDAAGTTRYTYTAAGQLLTETGPFASDTVTNIYNNENRLTWWEYDANGDYPVCGSAPETTSDQASQFIYDGLGRLRARNDYVGNGSLWQQTGGVEYIYDGMRVIQERNAGNTPTVSFTRGNDLSGSLEGAGGIGGLLARWQGPGLVWYYHADGNGNVMCLENTSQGIAESSRYDAYGNLVSGSFHEFGFSSKEYFSAGGLYYYGYRWYAPSLQRWLNRDPLGDVGSLVYDYSDYRKSFRSSEIRFETLGYANAYEFANNTPVNLEDLFGLCDCPAGQHSVPYYQQQGESYNRCLWNEIASTEGAIGGIIGGGLLGTLGGIAGTILGGACGTVVDPGPGTLGGGVLGGFIGAGAGALGDGILRAVTGASIKCKGQSCVPDN